MTRMTKQAMWALLATLWLAAWPARAQVVEYIHTDAQGTPIAVTDASGTVIERFEYEPYGLQVAGPVEDGPGYTGHVEDTLTSMTYMQQRYYDPGIGRFLSVDPVTADTVTGWNFNRYNYAANNPYKFKDPDGRIIDTLADIGFIAYDIYALVKQPSWTNAGALGADIVGAAVPFATGLGTGVRAAAHASDAAKAADKVHDSARGALRVAKERHGVPKSAQPDRTIKPSTPEGNKAGLDSRNVKMYEYTNSKGEKIQIRQDKPANYKDGGKGDQSEHFNSGKSGEKLNDHDYYRSE